MKNILLTSLTWRVITVDSVPSNSNRYRLISHDRDDMKVSNRFDINILLSGIMYIKI